MTIKQIEQRMLTEEEKQFAMEQMKTEEVELNQEIEMYQKNVRQAQELLAEEGVEKMNFNYFQTIAHHNFIENHAIIVEDMDGYKNNMLAYHINSKDIETLKQSFVKHNKEKEQVHIRFEEIIDLAFYSLPVCGTEDCFSISQSIEGNRYQTSTDTKEPFLGATAHEVYMYYLVDTKKYMCLEKTYNRVH